MREHSARALYLAERLEAVRWSLRIAVMRCNDSVGLRSEANL
jgi:hypothetical protein